MAINRVEIKDYLVFKGGFATNFCPGVNILIGGNATGKTTLLKALYRNVRLLVFHSNTPNSNGNGNSDFGADKFIFDRVKTIIDPAEDIHAVYIPEKDILEHAKGLLTFIEQKQTGFDQIYKDILIAAQDVPTQNQSEIQEQIGLKIAGIIGGEVHWDKGDGAFYTLNADGNRIPFANEASGYKKLGFLGLLLASGQLKSGTILFWDEPENSLNPELVPRLVDILLDLARNGVQIFLATHSEILASYFAVNRQKNDEVLFISMYKEEVQIKADKSDRFDLLVPNNLTLEPVKLYEKQLELGLSGNG